MKITKIVALVSVLILTCCLLIACNSTEVDTKGKTKVVFELEGGIYKNSDRPVTYWFGYKSGSQNLLKDVIGDSQKDQLIRNDYILDGWYRSKTTNGDVVTYSDKWNFETDKITAGEELTLYAKWVPSIKYTYQIYYRAADGAEVKIGDPYKVSKGATFIDVKKYATKKAPEGYTFVKYTDESGNDWDTKFKHPGGAEACEIKVYATYMKGDWLFVSSVNDLRKINVSGEKRNVYLMNDIDLKGKEISLGNFENRTFYGNGYTIKNFTVKYDAVKDGLSEDADGTPNTLFVGLFHNVTNSTIQDLKLENVKIELDAAFNLIKRIYVNPLCARAIGSSLKKITVSGTYKYVKVNEALDEDNKIICLNDVAAYKDETTVTEDCNVVMEIG